MLHYFLAYVLAPKFSNHSQIIGMDMQLIYSMKHKIQVNWAHVIMHHIVAYNENLRGLPYARFISKIFKFFGISTKDELHGKMTEKDVITTDMINNKMEIYYDIDDGVFKHIHEDIVEPSVPPKDEGPKK